MIVSVPSLIIRELERRIGSTVEGFSFSAGGCINNGGRITTAQGCFFLKWNDRARFPRMFEVEAKGLSILRQSNSLAVPRVIAAGEADSHQFLLLEYIVESGRSRDYWALFGAGLASMHRVTSENFGLDHDNYIGSLPQANKQSPSWVEFFTEQRLRPQLKAALENRKLDHAAKRKFDALFIRLSSLLPNEMPSLLHGDLWRGNIMTTPDGKPCLIDPAVYYGHREVDLAMTQLFGGFEESFFGSYNEIYPLLPGYQERFQLYNLYPLLVHVNLFGGGYASQVVRLLKKFV